MVLLLLTATLASPAAADTTNTDLARARARLSAAQAAADAAAGRYEAALQRDAALESELTRTQARIDASAQRVRVLKLVVQAIAVRAYVQAAEPTGPAVLFSGDDVLDLGRSTRLLNRANAPNVATISQLKATQDDLARDRGKLRDTEDASKKLLAQMKKDGERVQRELVAAGRETSRVEAEIAQQAAAAKAAADARARAAAATSTTTAAPADVPSGVASGTPTVRRSDPPPTRPSSPKTPDTKPSEPAHPTQPPPPPPSHGGGVLCPIRGPVSFVDSWGAARSGGRHHEGVDMIAPMGAINQAVVSGTITQKYGSRQGNGVFLSGDDGNSYWYFHLSRYAGGPRHVAKGEVIGYVGMTGNADGTVPHTHFEYHPGHGGPVDPYPLVKAACG
jgi:murein DD-endopeptidase MepM/ murein hydrolase activator NlpD